jgi:DNA helicase II / ATP-dependent DNA helicase PcrA
MMTNPFAQLNQEQIRAVTTVNGPLLVLAGPGSGKTRVLTRRIAHLIDDAGVAPWNILAVTFTNKAAGEMRQRVEQIFVQKFGPPPPGQPPRLSGLTIGTFHSICARILRVEVAAAGYQPNWVIYDSADQVALVREVLRELNFDEKRFPPKAVLAHISKQKNDLVTPEEYRAASYFEEIAGRVYRRYQEMLLTNNAMDFDDLLMRTVLLLRNNLELRAKYQQKWRYVLVDEFQDTNAAQYELIRLLVTGPMNHRNIFVVGDEDQSIYKFRGADYRNVRLFRNDFPEAPVVLLEQNYRSTQTILDVANSVISNNRQRTPKNLRTDNGNGLPVTVYEAYNEVEEAAYVADEIEKLQRRGEISNLGDVAVMYRTNAQSRALEEAFVLRGMKYRLIGATRFYERKEIKDALAYLRLIHNPADTVSLNRVINTPPRGIGDKAQGALRSWAAELGVSQFVALQVVHHGADRATARLGQTLSPQAATSPIGGRAQKALADFAELLERWVDRERAGRYSSVAELLDDVLLQSRYLEVLRDGTDEGEDRFENLQQLRAVAATYVPGAADLESGQTPLGMFLEQVSLVSDSDDLDTNASAVTLLTLHTAKGLEYGVVFIVGLEDGILPHSRTLEIEDAREKEEELAEERRLFYVGITRARRRLYLVHAFRRSLWGESNVQAPSRFLDEIPDDLLTGMVDKRGRQESSFKRMTSWRDDDDVGSTFGRTPQSQTGGQWSGRSKSAPPGWGQPGPGDTASRSKGAYWSPGGANDGSAPITRKPTPAKPPTPAKAGQFQRRDSVQHASFGVGTVIESAITREGEEVTVAFPGIGIKKLMAEYLRKM